VLQLGVHGAGGVSIDELARESRTTGAESANAKLELQLFGGGGPIIGRLEEVDQVDDHRIEVKEHESNDTIVAGVTGNGDVGSSVSPTILFRRG
jgi:hypothetical protein